MAQLDPLKLKDSCEEVDLISNPSIQDTGTHNQDGYTVIRTTWISSLTFGRKEDINASI